MNNNILRLGRLLLALSFITLLTACASSSVFSPYPNQATAFRQAASGLDTANVLLKLNGKRAGADRMLYLMERGRLSQLNGDIGGSKTDFDEVIAGFQANEEKAYVSATGVGATGAALLTNDNAIPYKGYAYERVMVHQFQAFNYLSAGDIEGATVELRRAQQVQRNEELRHEKEIMKANEEAAKNKVALNQFDSNFSGMDLIAGTVKNSFQNGYTFYTAAVIREALGEYNDALVDYKKALEMQPDNVQIQNDVLRVNRRFGGDAPVATPTAAKTANGNGKVKKERVDMGTVVVLFEQGFVPAKSAIGLPIPTTNGGIFSVQFPVYTGADYTPPVPLTVRLPDGTTAQTSVLVNTGALAVKALKEQIPAMLVRQTLRAAAKYQMQKEAADRGGVFGQLAANLYNLASEQADLRSWLTLPSNAQAVRVRVPAGSQSIELVSGMGSLPVPVEVRDGKTTIIRAIEVNGQLKIQTFNL